jgi:hypothetical protein
MATSTLFQLPGDGATTLAVLRRLLEALPVYGLEVGPDIEAVPTALQDLLASLRSETR